MARKSRETVHVTQMLHDLIGPHEDGDVEGMANDLLMRFNDAKGTMRNVLMYLRTYKALGWRPPDRAAQESYHFYLASGEESGSREATRTYTGLDDAVAALRAAVNNGDEYACLELLRDREGTASSPRGDERHGNRGSGPAGNGPGSGDSRG